jgi:hypothetical protein
MNDNLHWVNEYYRIKVISMAALPACLLLALLVGVIISTIQEVKYRMMDFFRTHVPRYIVVEYKDRWGEAFWNVEDRLLPRHFIFRGEEWYNNEGREIGTKAMAKMTVDKYGASFYLDNFEPFTNSLSQRMRLWIGEIRW